MKMTQTEKQQKVPQVCTRVRGRGVVHTAFQENNTDDQY